MLVPQEAPQAEAAPLDKLAQLLRGNPRLASVEPVLQQGIEWLQKAQSAAPSMITQAMTRLKNRRPPETTQPTLSAETEPEAPEDLD
ncbi:hypothetical protein D3C86_1687040 [compost metagenome]